MFVRSETIARITDYHVWAISRIESTIKRFSTSVSIRYRRFDYFFKRSASAWIAGVITLRGYQ